MRIISGKLKGIRINPPRNLPVRPTTDLSKEALFNILQHMVDFDETSVLDLFAGTGNMTYEFASRGCPQVTAVDAHFNCARFIKETAASLKLEGVNVMKSDVFKFLEIENEQYDLIFADPPYDLPRLTEIPGIVFQKGLLKAGGMLIVEHPALRKLDNLPNFDQQRTYGQSAFSFFIHA
jgi:16S rRNA (guanine966-N2)-methyltransferase